MEAKTIAILIAGIVLGVIVMISVPQPIGGIVGLCIIGAVVVLIGYCALGDMFPFNIAKGASSLFGVGPPKYPELYDGTCCNLTANKNDKNSCIYCQKPTDGGTGNYFNIAGGVKVGDPASQGAFCASSRACGNAEDYRWTCADIWTLNTTIEGEVCKEAGEAGVNIGDGDPIGSVSVNCNKDKNGNPINVGLIRKIWTDSRFNSCLAGPSKMTVDQINTYKQNLNAKDTEKLRIKNDGTPAPKPPPFTKPGPQGLCAIVA